MRLEQLRYLCEIVDAKFNISRAAESLHISQPAISKQIRLLEDELKVDLLIRNGARIAGLTAAGQSILPRAREVLIGTAGISRLGAEVSAERSGTLVIATTHTHARYSLLPVIETFMQEYPGVHLRLVQANPAQILEAIASGKADIGVSSDEGDYSNEVVQFRGMKLERCVMALRGHPVFKLKRLTLQGLSTYPLILLDPSFAGGRIVLEGFSRRGLSPNVVMTATDSDVIKAYAKLGLGVAILPMMTFDPAPDAPLRALPANHLFGSAQSTVLVRANTYIPTYMRAFIERIAPNALSRRSQRLTRALSRQS